MKTAHIHIGPHKTGSTAIQKFLSVHHDRLRERYGLHAFSGPDVYAAARILNQGEETAFGFKIDAFAAQANDAARGIVMSCEDFSGVLPGRTGGRKPYPKLHQNLAAIRKALPGYRCRFYFFIRDLGAWKRSAYFQILKHSSRFRSFDSYAEFVRLDAQWVEVLEKARSKLPGLVVEIPYAEGPDFSSSQSLMQAILGPETPFDLPDPPLRANQSSSAVEIGLMEQINIRSGASEEALRRAKRMVREGTAAPPDTEEAPDPDDLIFPDWPNRPERPKWLAPDLKALWTRVSRRVSRQHQPNLLPDPFGDLAALRARAVQAPEAFPENGRADMADQIEILKHRFDGLPETCLLLGTTISYLRRETAHTAHAAFLFQRLWQEEHALLLGALPTRWLISTFQTFMEHGTTEAQRQIGAASYFYANMLKAYEAERALDGLSPDATYPGPAPTTPLGFPGLDRYPVGGTDMLLNTNAVLLDLAARDACAGRVTQEFVLRTKAAHTLFSRMDASRVAQGVDMPGFLNCWSFFEDPREKGPGG